MSRLKILWLSNSGRAPTGYGNQTGLFVPVIKAAGYDISVFAFYGAEATPSIDENGVIVLPRLRQPYGNDIVDAHYKFTGADMVLTLIDPFVLEPGIYNDMNWVSWAPIDSEPVMPATVENLRAAQWILAMSKFGEGQLKEAGFKNVLYVPHGIDTGLFTPVDRDAAKKKLSATLNRDLAGKFVVASNMANKGSPSRKGFFEGLAAFKVFSDQHKDAILYLHTEKNGIWNGEHLPTVISMLGLDPAKVIFAPQYQLVMGMLAPAFLRDIYNVADVLLHPSHGEGFGIPIVEAQASGCPVIVTDFSAMSELCFSGWKVPGIPFMYTPGATQRIPLIPQLVTALEAAYQDRFNKELRAAAREGALRYDVKTVAAQYMLPALETVAMNLAEKANRLTPMEIV